MKGAAFIGDTDAEVLMTHVMSRYKSEFMHISYVYLSDHELAEIAVSNVFLTMARRLNRYPGQAEEKVWALRYLIKCTPCQGQFEFSGLHSAGYSEII